MKERTPATEAARLCVLRAGQAEMLVQSITNHNQAVILEAKTSLEIARNHWRKAKTLGCPADVLDAAAAAGHKAAAAIATAEQSMTDALEASRALALKKARYSRAYELKGMFVKECAKYVAESLVSKGLATDFISAVQATIKLLPCDPYLAKPEDIFEAWLILDPIPAHPFALAA